MPASPFQTPTALHFLSPPSSEPSSSPFVVETNGSVVTGAWVDQGVVGPSVDWDDNFGVAEN